MIMFIDDAKINILSRGFPLLLEIEKQSQRFSPNLKYELSVARIDE